MNIKSKYYIVLLTVFPILLFAETRPSFLFESSFKLNHIDAIAQSEINDLYCDSRGFMWIATPDGLIRFDGIKTTTHRMHSGKNSISSNMIKQIAEDRRGNIWLSTYGKGLCRYDIKQDIFTAFNNSEKQQCIFENDINEFLIHQNYIWTCDQHGISRYKLDSTMNKIVAHSHLKPQQLNEENNIEIDIKTIFEDYNNNIWIGSNLFSYKIDNPYDSISQLHISKFYSGTSVFLNYYPAILLGGENLHFYNEQQNANKLTYLYDAIGYIALQQDTILWIGTPNSLEGYKWDANGLQQLSNFAAYPPFSNIKDKVINCLEVDKHGQLWIGSRGGGIDIISNKKAGINHYRPSKNKGSIESKLINAIYEDSQENLWIGSKNKGLQYLKGKDKHNYTSGFQNYKIVNYPDNNIANTIAEQQTPRSKRQKSIIWVGTGNPTYLVGIDPKTMKEIPSQEITQNLGFVITLLTQNDSTLWVGTYGRGLWKLSTDIDGNIIKHKHYTSNNEHPNTITSNIIRGLLIDTKDNLWVGTDEGISKLYKEDMESGHFQNYYQKKNSNNLSFDYILQIFESKSGHIWMGSMGGGLIGIEKEIEKDSIVFFAITEEDGLANNAVKGIVEDNCGYLWLSTNNGLSKYCPLSGKIVNYDITDGLQSNCFTEIAATKRQNGDIILGGYNGFNVINPELIKNDTIRPTLYFVDFYILNQTIGESKQNRKQSVEYTKSITLNHNENSFSIEFSAIHYNSAHKNKFKYKLEGFDYRWINTTSDECIAKYTNIPPGHYSFKVLGANSDNVWTEQAIMLDIEVKAHPLLRPLAWLTYSIIFLITLLLSYRVIYLLNMRKHKAMVAEIEKQKTEELTQSKLLFFTNISHEFRTPLTLISLPLEQMLDKPNLPSNKRTEKLNVIKHNSEILLRLVNQILDFRKMEQGSISLNLKQQDFIPFAKKVSKSFQLIANEKDINIAFQCDRQSLCFEFDEDKLEKILNNLIHNAIKFTNTKGHIIIKTIECKRTIIIQVIDNGIGIAPKDQNLVFERYHQQNNLKSQKLSGTGIGLSYTKAMVELHGGIINLDSKLGKGSTFSVTLPTKQVKKSSNNSKNTEHQAATTTPQTQNDLTTYEQSKHYKLLIVEDNKELNNLIVEVFSPQYTIVQAFNGKEAYDSIKKSEPDLIISDIMMPVMNGIELLTKIKNEEAISHIPVILLSAKSTVEDQIKGHIEGADAYISKPFNTNVLLAKSQAILRNRERLKVCFQKEIEINPLTIANSPSDANFIERLLKIVESNLTNADFNTEQMALEYGMSRMSLYRKTKALTGQTPLEFIRNIRLKHAVALMIDSNLNVSNAAFEVGFNDLSTFRCHFKRQYGMSPSTYIKQHQEKNKTIDSTKP